MFRAPKFNKNLFAVAAKNLALLNRTLAHLATTTAQLYLRLGGGPVVWPTGSGFDVILPDLKQKLEDLILHGVFKHRNENGFTPSVSYSIVTDEDNASALKVDISIEELFITELAVLKNMKTKRPELYQCISYLMQELIWKSPCIVSKDKFTEDLWNMDDDPESSTDEYFMKLKVCMQEEIEYFEQYMPKRLSRRKKADFMKSLPDKLNRLNKHLSKDERKWINEAMDYIRTDWPTLEGMSEYFEDNGDRTSIYYGFYFIWECSGDVDHDFYFSEVNDLVNNFGSPTASFLVRDKKDLGKIAVFTNKLCKLMWLMFNWERLAWKKYQ